MASKDPSRKSADKKTSSEPSQPARNTAQIEADVTAARHRIANSMESLIDQVHPNRIKQREIQRVRNFVDTEVETAKSLIFNARGDLRTDRVVVIAAAAAGAIAFVVIVRALSRRGRGA